MATNISILNGTLLKFLIDFSIPANSGFSKVEIVDNLPVGLTFNSLSINSNGTPLVENTDYTLTPITIWPVTLTQSYLNNLTQAANIEVTVVAKINDISLLPPVSFTNTATITPYVGTTAKTGVTDTATINYTHYNLYGFGGSTLIAKEPNKQVNLTMFVPTFDSFSPVNNLDKPCLDYYAVITPNANLGLTLNAANIITTVYAAASDGSYVILNPATDYSVDFSTPGKVIVSVSSIDILRNTSLYINLLGTTGNEITLVPDSVTVLNSPVDLSIIDICNSNAIVATSVEFFITTNLDNSKTITFVKKTLL